MPIRAKQKSIKITVLNDKLKFESKELTLSEVHVLLLHHLELIKNEIIKGLNNIQP